MGRLEEENRKKGRRNAIRTAVLASVQVAGILAVAAVAPNAIRALRKYGLLEAPRQNESIRRSYRDLLERGFVQNIKGHTRLTPKGEVEMRRLERLTKSVSKPKRWDGKWRVLIFDIPEYRKTLRDKVRRTLDTIGFTRLQDSVWVYPYACEDFITLLKADFRVGKDVLYMIVESLENDRLLRKKYKLQ